MKTSNLSSIPEKSLKIMTGHTKMIYARMIDEYIWLIKRFNQLKLNVKDERLKEYLDFYGFNFVDEKGKIKWELIRNFLPTELEKRIKDKYGKLSEKEIRLCCLLLFDVPLKNISIILPYKEKSIYTLLCRIKEKTGINDITEMYGEMILKLH